MKTSFVAASLISSAIVSILLLSTAGAQAAPTSNELDEVTYAQALREAGYSAPAIEEVLQARRASRTRDAAEKAARVQTIAGAEEKKAPSHWFHPVNE